MSLLTLRKQRTPSGQHGPSTPHEIGFPTHSWWAEDVTDDVGTSPASFTFEGNWFIGSRTMTRDSGTPLLNDDFGVNNRRALALAGGQYRCTTNTTGQATSGYSAAVYERPAADTGVHYWTDFGNSGTRALMGQLSDTQLRFFQSGTLSVEPVVSAGTSTAQLYEMLWTPTSMEAWVDGVSVGSSAGTANAASVTGSWRYGVSAPTGRLAAAYYSIPGQDGRTDGDEAITPADQQALRDFYADFYGLTLGGGDFDPTEYWSANAVNRFWFDDPDWTPPGDGVCDSAALVGLQSGTTSVDFTAQGVPGTFVAGTPSYWLKDGTNAPGLRCDDGINHSTGSVVAAFYTPDSATDDQMIHTSWQVRMLGGNVQGYAGTFLVGPPVPTSGTWNIAVAAFNGDGTSKVRLNGVEVVGNAGNTSSGTQSIYGRRIGSGTEMVAGTRFGFGARYNIDVTAQPDFAEFEVGLANEYGVVLP